MKYDNIDAKIEEGKPLTKAEWEYYRKNTLKKYLKGLDKTIKLK